MKQRDSSYFDIERVVFSRQYRSLQDKTQLFYPSQKRRVRTRLTHTQEVKTIAHKIGVLLNREIDVYNQDPANKAAKKYIQPVDLELVDAIAYAHDIGHTPFGHVGERTIDAVVSGKDDLGGLIHYGGEPRMRFKHNSNAMRILVDMKISDWRVIEGALCHTGICYDGDKTEYQGNPFNPFAQSEYKKMAAFIFGENQMDFTIADKKDPVSMTLEGQIVAAADEIAQRAADIADADIQNRYMENIEALFAQFFPTPQRPGAADDDRCFRLEWMIYTAMINDVVDHTMDNLRAATPKEAKFGDIEHVAYADKIVAFTPDETDKNDPEKVIKQNMAGVNKELENFVTAYSARSEEVRESDSRAKYIIRQLYKAYLNDVSLLPDAVIETHLNRMQNNAHFLGAVKNHEAVENVLKKRYAASKIIPEKGKKLLAIKNVTKYVDLLKENNGKVKSGSADADLTALFDAFILDIGFYIASLTNTEAFDAYNKIYGHTL